MQVKKDLVVVVPDLDIEITIDTLLKQAQKLGIVNVSWVCVVLYLFMV